MKNAKSLLITAIFSVVALTAVSFPSIQAFAQDQKAPSKQALRTLLETARAPADHLRIAACYRQEAARQRQIAKEHSELAALYGKTHPHAAMEAKHGDSFGQGVSHCQKFAELALEQAKQDDALVSFHEDMAKEAEQKR